MAWELVVSSGPGALHYVVVDTDDIRRDIREWQARGYKVIRWRLLGPVSV